MLVAHNMHVMVIDGANRSLFRNRGEGLAPDLERIDHRHRHAERTSDLGTEKPGRSFQSAGSARSSYENTDYHQREEDDFANAATDQLNVLLTNGATAILIAAPHVLGVMLKRLEPEARSRIKAVIDRDYAQRSVEDITELLVSL